MGFDIGNGYTIDLDSARVRCGIHGTPIVEDRCADCDALYRYFTAAPSVSEVEWLRYFDACDVIARNAGYRDRHHLYAAAPTGMALYMYAAADREIKRDR